MGRAGRVHRRSSPLVSSLTLVAAGCGSSVLVPTLYLATFVWENVLLPQPEPTRYIVLGAMLSRS